MTGLRPLLAAALLLAGCAVADPRPVFHPAVSSTDGQRTLVVGVERDPANRPTTEALAREFAFGLAQRGQSSLDLASFLDWAETVGRPFPEPLRLRLLGGVADGEIAGWLRAERVRHVVFLEVQVFEQVWAQNGKRTRVGLSARGRDLSNGDQAWYAHATPDVEDEPGRGFQLATEAGVTALLRVINGERELPSLPKLTLPRLVIPDVPVKAPW